MLAIDKGRNLLHLTPRKYDRFLQLKYSVGDTATTTTAIEGEYQAWVIWSTPTSRYPQAKAAMPTVNRSDALFYKIRPLAKVHYFNAESID